MSRPPLRDFFRRTWLYDKEIHVSLDSPILYGANPFELLQKMPITDTNKCMIVYERKDHHILPLRLYPRHQLQRKVTMDTKTNPISLRGFAFDDTPAPN